MSTSPNTRRPQLSILVISFNTREVLRTCLSRLSDELEGLSAEVLVIDNASNDGSADMVAEAYPNFSLIRSSTNLGFAAGNNVGLRQARGEYMVLLNPDAFLGAGSLRMALARMESQPATGLAGGRLQDRHGNPQPSARLFPSLLNEFLVLSGLADSFPHSKFFGRFDRTWADPTREACVDWVPGAFTIIRRAALDKIGLFDERFFLYYEEVDLCRRIVQAGYEIRYWPEIVVTHLGGESSKTVKSLHFSNSGSQLTLWRMRSALLYYRKHHGKLATWLVAHLETGWQRLRLLKPHSAARRESIVCQIEMMQSAWQDTGGGAVAPARPW